MKRLTMVLLAVFLMILPGCGATWFPDDSQSSSGTPAPGSTPTPTPTPSPGGTPQTVDATGRIHLVQIKPVENFRNYSSVSFSTQLTFINVSSARKNFRCTINGVTASGAAAFTKDYFSAIDGNQTVTTVVSYDEMMPIAQYDSITSWYLSGFTTF